MNTALWAIGNSMVPTAIRLVGLGKYYSQSKERQHYDDDNDD
jgi:hypothetical protein